MGASDRSLLRLLYKVTSWISGAISMESWVSGGRPCLECQSSGDHRCRSCGRLFCRKCMQSPGDPEFEKSDFCKFCYRAVGRHLKAEESSEKPALSVPNERIPESPLSRFSETRLAQFADSQQGSSPQSLCCYTLRSYEDEDAEDGGRHFFSPMSEASQDNSDTDAISVGTWTDFYSLKSSPMDSPSRPGDQEDNSPVLARADPQDQGTPGYFRKNRVEAEDLLENTNGCSYGNHVVYGNQDSQKAQPPLDFDNNYLIWYPPPPEDEEDDVETGFFGYDDDDDDGSSNTVFSPGSFSTESTNTFSIKGKPNDANKEHLRSAVHGHFRALVCQLLQGEGLHVGSGNDGEGWLEIVSSIAWQAGTFVKPDTGKGGSMDPGDYVKVKCISSGIPSNSTLIKGIVCTKNVKHKRMVSQHRNPKILLLGGSLEYQRAPNRLASINTIIQQESDHLKMAVSKIESHRPNVLMVEKSVSPYAQEYLLAKEISLVLNVKRTLLDRISRCTGAQIITAVDNLTSAKLGQCEMFRIEKVSEECSSGTHPSKKSTKTLMFFEGCPRRLGCTVLLRGSCHEELKKVKHVVQYASFAAYHLSLETSFLADEGASLPKFPLKPPVEISETMSANTCIETSLTPSVPNTHINCSLPCSDVLSPNIDILGINSEQEKQRVSSEDISPTLSPVDPHTNGDCTIRSIAEVSCCVPKRSIPGFQFKDCQNSSQVRTAANILESDVLVSSFNEGNISVNPRIIKAAHEQKVIPIDDGSVPSEYFSASDNHQSILVSLSSSCVVKDSVCERSQLFRIKFYGSFDKPLGRYLRDDLFDQISLCRSCKEPAEAHIRCYTHQQGNLTINVRRLSSMKLPGERDGRIWMWHRCLKCEHKDGVPPAARRVVMSDAAWGLSFGKFLELSFSNHTTANRIASCGHSLQRDCLRFYGFGSMVAFFRYSPVDILSIQLPPQFLEFSCDLHQDWVKIEAFAIFRKVESFYEEVSTLLRDIEQRITATVCDSLNTSIHKHIVDLKDLLKMERREYDDLLPASTPNAQPSPAAADILELNRLRRCLLIDSYTWDRRLYLLDSVSKSKSLVFNADPQLSEILNRPKLNEWREESFCQDEGPGDSSEETMMKSLTLSCTFSNSLLSKQNEDTRLQILEYNSNNMVEMDLTIQSFGGYVGPAGFNLLSGQCYRHDEESISDDVYNDASISEGLQSPETNLSDKIDLAWTGSAQILTSSTGNVEPGTVGSYSLMANLTHRKVISPARVHSFDSALRFQSKISRGLSPSLHLSSVRSFDYSREFGKDPNRLAYTQSYPRATRSRTPGLIKSAAHMANEEARLLLPQPGLNNMVIAVYENDPTSIISYAISSQEHASFIASKCRRLIDEEPNSYLHSDDIQSQFHGSDEPQRLRASPMLDPKEHNFRISFDDESSTPGDKVKFSVISYFAKEFDALRKKCCPSEVDFIRSMSRCRRWKAQGGKSNVFFAKSLDERFIIKQVTKTELDSFEEFAPEYFKYLMESINSGSPTCLAKVLGIYQVTNKHVKGGREVKMDLMVMENLFYRRNISRVYDLKGSSRARYNSDTSGNKVLLDLNLLETLRTKPIFLGKKAKRILERAVWNDTSFLASIDVMDYSLLVGVDEERKELVIGIIDFMRQYTWDKHLETWVKAAGILGGPKNTSPTVVSPKQYKKRFRKAMSSYFLTVPDQWSS